MKEKLRLVARYYLPLGLWLAMIFRFSYGAYSSQFSSGLIQRLLRSINPALLLRLQPAQLDLLNTILRKTAHLTEYAVLAILTCRAYAHGKPKRYPTAYAAALVAAALYACADEAHQSFFANRTSSYRDVLIDSGGALLGIVLIWFLERKHAKCRTSVSLN
ncbi:MAG TPA: VanZ family protein [Armatimonadota bacterium]|nr:VanZ family protein [Armatimonadota bacterium]